MEKTFELIPSVYGCDNNFIWPLTLILLMLGITVFIKVQFDLLHPAFLFIGGITACCALDATVIEMWDLPFHFNTAIILVGMVGCFLAGSVLVEASTHYREGEGNSMTKIGGVSIGAGLWISLMLISLFCTYMNYREFLELARQVTNAENIKDMLFPVIDGIAHNKIEFSRGFAYRIVFVKCVAYVALFFVWKNMFVRQYVNCIKWGSLLFSYPVVLFFTGGRQAFLYLAMFGVVSYILVLRQNTMGSRCEVLKKELRIVSLGLGMFLLFFIGIGLLNGKIGNLASSFQVMAHYGGTNISAFDVYINQIQLPENSYIGTSTLNAFYSLLRKIGVSVPDYTSYITDFVDFRYITTNVYTAFYRYIQDYGFVGCGVLLFILGYVYTYAYRSVARYGLKNWMILAYSAITFPLFLMGREERFLNETFVLQQIVTVFMLSGLNYLIDHNGKKLPR